MGDDILTEEQKILVDIELEKIKADQSYLLDWDSVKVLLGIPKQVD